MKYSKQLIPSGANSIRDQQLLEKYFEWAEDTVNDWYHNQKAKEATGLNNKLSEEPFFDEAAPQFFSGDIASDTVLVHLNPRKDKGKEDEMTKEMRERIKNGDFEKYFGYLKNLGTELYKNRGDHKSPFDKKQIHFLRGFSSTDLGGEEDDISKDHLENSLNNKLQVELLPFGSKNFKTNELKKDVGIEGYIQKNLELIFSIERELVVFCGSIFRDLLLEHTCFEKRVKFPLKKKDGKSTDPRYELIKARVKFQSLENDVLIAPQYPMQGLPMKEYGKKASEFWKKEDFSKPGRSSLTIDE